eukprot:1294624-Pyramimonas_sp.AAC.1
MKKPVRKVRRFVRRSLRGKGKGRSKGRETAGMHQAKVKGGEEIQWMPTVKLWSATYSTVHNISGANAPKVMEEAGVRQCTWLQRSPTCSGLIGGGWFLADPAGSSVTIVHSMAARCLSASVALDTCADE